METLEILFCRKCGANLSPDSNFCYKCGTKINRPQESKDVVLDCSTPANDTCKNKKKTARNIVVCIIALILVGFIVWKVIELSDNRELRNFASEEMCMDYTNVYADVVSMKPVYYICSEYGNDSGITYVVCKCKTVEERIIFAVIYIWDYPDDITGNELITPVQYYSKSNPMRLIGRVSTPEKVNSELANQIDDIFILDVKKFEPQ